MMKEFLKDAGDLFGMDVTKYLTVEFAKLAVKIGILIFVGIPFVYWLSKRIRTAVGNRFSHQQGMIVGKVVFYLCLFLVFLSVLRQLDIKLDVFLGAAGVLGIAVGFASQTSLSNIISGFFLMAEKPFVVGDVITVGTTTGQILSIDTLSVKLRTFDNLFVRIPNENIIKSQFTNITRFPIRRVDLNISVAYKEDIGKVRDVLLDLAHENPLCLEEPEPMVVFTGYGASSIDILFCVWAVKEEWLQVKNSMMEEIKRRFDEEGIEIPFPHVTLYTGAETKPIPIEIIEPKGKSLLAFKDGETCQTVEKN